MLRTRVVWTGVAGTPWYSNFYWGGDTQSNATDASEQTAAWLTGIVGVVIPAVRGTLDPEVYRIIPESGEITGVFPGVSSTSVGSVTGEPLPFRTQVRTVFGTVARRRSRAISGASFVGGLSEDISSTGVGPQEPVRESIQDVYTSALMGGPASLQVWARPLPATSRFPAAIGNSVPVTSARTQTVWSSLRSRGA